jgi:hypothetical protein
VETIKRWTPKDAKIKKGIADTYFFFLLGLRPLHISCVGVGGLSPISISGEYSGKRSMSAGSSGSNFVGVIIARFLQSYGFFCK